MELIEYKPFRTTIYIFEFLVMGLVGFLVTVRLLVYGGEEVKVPLFLGKSISEAESIAHYTQIRIQIKSEQYSDDYSEGSVLFQEIPAGESVRVGRAIHVILSKGARDRFAPKVIGMEEQTATTLLSSSSLQKLENNESCSDYMDNRLVIAQNPPIQETLSKSGVSILVSKGPCFNRFIMPDVRGVPLQDVLQEMNQKKFLTRWVRYVEKEEVSPNLILSTQPLPGSIVEPGDTITLEVSMAPKIEGWGEDVEWNYIVIPSNPGFSSPNAQLFLERGLPELIYSMDVPLNAGEKLPMVFLAPSGSSASLLIEGKEVWRKEMR